MVALPPGVVHLWHADLDCAGAKLERLESYLSEDEWVRAARFRFARDRQRFIAARGLLRRTLSRYLDLDAAQLRFAYGPWGKPWLPEFSRLRFNLAHSQDKAFLAVAHEREVGVDIERVRTDIETAALAELVFTKAEIQMLCQLDVDAGHQAFFGLWTRKEALIKADGRGVSLPLTQIDVSVSDSHVLMLDKQAGTWQVCEHWLLRDISVDVGYAAAVVVEATVGAGQELEIIRLGDMAEFCI